MSIHFDVTDIESLAPMPRSVAYLAKLQYEPEIWLNEVSRVINLDEALTAMLLHWANSAWSHTTVPVGNVKDALIRMGIVNVLNLIIITSLSSPLKKACPAYNLKENELSQHSIIAYLTAVSLGEFSAQPIPDTATTAALIHDLGKLLLGRYIDRDMMNRIAEAVKSGQMSLIEAEQNILGTDHAEVGKAIAVHWKFPSALAEAIHRHHDPKPPYTTLLDAVQLCDIMAKQICRVKDNAKPLWEDHLEQLQRLGIEPADMALLSIRVEDELTKIETLL